MCKHSTHNAHRSVCVCVCVYNTIWSHSDAFCIQRILSSRESKTNRDFRHFPQTRANDQALWAAYIMLYMNRLLILQFYSSSYTYHTYNDDILSQSTPPPPKSPFENHLMRTSGLIFWSCRLKASISPRECLSLSFFIYFFSTGTIPRRISGGANETTVPMPRLESPTAISLFSLRDGPLG